jgi:hypothetical protein
MLVGPALGYIHLIPLIVCGDGNRLVDRFDHIRLYQLAVSQDADGSSITVEQCSVLCQLPELELRQFHESVYFVLRALEVLDTKCIDGNDLDAGLVADFQDLVGYN